MEMLKVPNTFTLGDWGCSESCVNSHTLEMYRRAKNSKSVASANIHSAVIPPRSGPTFWHLWATH